MPDNKPFYLKIVGFCGRFKGDSKPLKDLVYLADGAPVDNIPIFTNYIVLGEGGETTKAMKRLPLALNAAWHSGCREHARQNGYADCKGDAKGL